METQQLDLLALNDLNEESKNLELRIPKRKKIRNTPDGGLYFTGREREKYMANFTTDKYIIIEDHKI